jgi:hypothetical protein
MCSSWLDLSDDVSSSPNIDCMRNLRPWKVDVSTTPIEAHKHFGISSPEVRVFSFMIYDKKAFGASFYSSSFE